jgi:hypothetical protein
VGDARTRGWLDLRIDELARHQVGELDGSDGRPAIHYLFETRDSAAGIVLDDMAHVLEDPAASRGDPVVEDEKKPGNSGLFL